MKRRAWIIGGGFLFLAACPWVLHVPPSCGSDSTDAHATPVRVEAKPSELQERLNRVADDLDTIRAEREVERKER